MIDSEIVRFLFDNVTICCLPQVISKQVLSETIN